MHVNGILKGFWQSEIMFERCGTTAFGAHEGEGIDHLFKGIVRYFIRLDFLRLHPNSMRHRLDIR